MYLNEMYERFGCSPLNSPICCQVTNGNRSSCHHHPPCWMSKDNSVCQRPIPTGSTFTNRRRYPDLQNTSNCSMLVKLLTDNLIQLKVRVMVVRVFKSPGALHSECLCCAHAKVLYYAKTNLYDIFLALPHSYPVLFKVVSPNRGHRKWSLFRNTPGQVISPAQTLRDSRVTKPSPLGAVMHPGFLSS